MLPSPARSRLYPTVTAVLTVLGASACRSTRVDQPAPAPSVEPAPLLGAETRVHSQGELGHAHDYQMSVESVRDCPLDPPFSAKSGFVKVGVEVVVEGLSTSEVPVNPFYATLYDVTGESYTSTLAGCEPGVPTVRVTLGKTARGFVTFEVPKSQRKLELRYAPLVIGPGPEELRFAVTR